MGRKWGVVVIYKENPNMLVPYYLMHSYLYYTLGEPIIDDTEYDGICSELKERWDEVEHYHKHLIEKEALDAGTGYQLKYNKRIINAAMLLHERK